MDLFSKFCNICYKIDNGSLKDISEENMKHLNDTLITFVGHEDIIKHDVIYLCQFCCAELTRFDTFREMCFSNLIKLRQRYINMKLELEDDACAVKNTLQKFLYEEVLRKSSLEKINCPISISTDCHEIIKCSADLNQDCSVLNRQIINFQSQTNDCEFDSACSEVCVINSVIESAVSRVAVTNEEDLKNEKLTRSKNTRLKKFKVEIEDFDVPDASYGNECDTSQIEFMKEEFGLKNEIQNSDWENFAMKYFENVFDEKANLEVKVPVVCNSESSVNSGMAPTKEELNVKQENSTSECLELQTMEDEFGHGLNVAFKIANVCTIVSKEHCGQQSRSEDSKTRMKLRNRRSNNTLPAVTTDARPNHLSVREYRNRRSSKTLQSGAHNRVYSSVATHTCAVCNKACRNRSTLTIHESVHSNDRPYECTVCNKTFVQSRTLTVHQRTHNGDRPYTCTVCNKTFVQSGALTVHQRIHSGSKPYKCTVCNKSFRQSGTLTAHKRLHSGDKPYKCPICNKTYTTLSVLTVHERIHSGDRPYKCTVCNKSYKHSKNLTIHKRIHSGERPYKCIVCDKTFTLPGTLTIHARIHSGVRPYKCNVCNKAFTQSASLSIHQRIHSGAKPFKCTICYKTFRYSGSLAKHKLVHKHDKT